MVWAWRGWTRIGRGVESVELEPFAPRWAGVDTVMTARLRCPPSIRKMSRPRFRLRFFFGLLRDESNFRGIVVTDAMDMQGLASLYDTAEASVRALEQATMSC